MTVYDQATAIINTAQTTASTAVTQALQYTDLAATQVAVDGNAAGVSVTYSKVSAQKLPTYAEAQGTVKSDVGYWFSSFPDKFQKNIETILKAYFPQYSAETIATASPQNPTEPYLSQQWIIGMLGSSPTTGLPAPVEAALFSRGQDRLLTEALRTEDDALSMWANRGFSLPPGVLVSRLQQSQQDAASKIGDLSRDVLVENTRITVESVRIAAQLSVQLRLGVVDALAKLMNACAQINTSTLDYSHTIRDLQYKLAEVILQYYGTQVRESELAMEAQARAAEANVGQLGHLVNLDVGVLSTNTQRIVGAANATGALAAAAMASQISHVSLSSVQNQ